MHTREEYYFEREIYQSTQNVFVAANFKTAFVMEGTDPVISYPLMLLSKGSLTPVTITEATIDAEGITLSYNAHALIPELYDTDEIIACALLKTGELLTAGQFIGHKYVAMYCTERRWEKGFEFGVGGSEERIRAHFGEKVKP